MVIETKLYENGLTILNSLHNTDPTCFFIEFSALPRIGTAILIQDGPGAGEYIVKNIVFEVRENKGHPIIRAHK